MENLSYSAAIKYLSDKIFIRRSEWPEGEFIIVVKKDPNSSKTPRPSWPPVRHFPCIGYQKENELTLGWVASFTDQKSFDWETGEIS